MKLCLVFTWVLLSSAFGAGCTCGSSKTVDAGAPPQAVPAPIAQPAVGAAMMVDAGLVADAGPQAPQSYATLDRDRCIVLPSGRLLCHTEDAPPTTPGRAEPRLPSEHGKPRGLADGGVPLDAVAKLAALPAGELVDVDAAGAPVFHCAVYRSGAVDCGEAPRNAGARQVVGTPIAVAAARVPPAVRTGLAGCALNAEGQAQCWHFGRPARALPSKEVVAIAASRTDACALTRAGRVECFRPSGGPSGRVATLRPKKLPTASAIVGVSQGFCALVSGGRLFCFGDSARTDPYVAAPVGERERFEALTAGVDVVCGLRSEGAPYCFTLGAWERVRPEVLTGAAEPELPGTRRDPAPRERGTTRGTRTTDRRRAPKTREAPAPAPSPAAPSNVRLAATIGRGRLCVLTPAGVLECTPASPGAGAEDEEASGEELQALPPTEARALDVRCPVPDTKLRPRGFTKDGHYFVYDASVRCARCAEGERCGGQLATTVVVDVGTGERVRYTSPSRKARRRRGSRKPSKTGRNREVRLAADAQNASLAGVPLKPLLELEQFLAGHELVRMRRAAQGLRIQEGVRYARVAQETQQQGAPPRKRLWRWRSEATACGAPTVRTFAGPTPEHFAVWIEWPGYRCNEGVPPAGESWMLVVGPPRAAPAPGAAAGVQPAGVPPLDAPALAPRPSEAAAPPGERVEPSRPALRAAPAPRVETSRDAPKSPDKPRAPAPPIVPGQVTDTGPKDE